MFRSIVSVVIGFLATIAIAWLFTVLLSSGPELPSAPERTVIEAAPSASASITKIDLKFTEVPSCELEAERVQSLIESFKGCDTDSACTLFSPGCPFGCTDSIQADSIPIVQEAYRIYSEKCPACVYMCANSPYGRYAACDGGRCVMKEKRRPDLEGETERLLTTPDA